MAANLTITLTALCRPGGSHQTIEVTGAVTRSLFTSIDPNEPMSAEEQEAFVKGCVKLAKIGRTNAQLLTVMQAGLDVSVE